MIDAWWGSLEMAHQVFYVIAVGTTFLLVLQLGAMLFGIGGDGDIGADIDADLDGGFDDLADGDTGVNLISFRTVTAFFTGFGWGGVGALNAGWSLTAAVLTAVASGVLFMALVLGVVMALFRLEASGNIRYTNAIGQVGRVYLPIAQNMERAGQVEVIVQGRLSVLPAFTRAARRLENEERVRVTEVLDQSTLVVEPLDAPTTPSTED